MPATPTTVMCTFRVRTGHEEDLVALLRREWAALHGAGLVTDISPQLVRGEDDEGRPYYVHIFTWHDADAARSAHDHPEVAAIWREMDAVCEARDGQPAMEFPHVLPMSIGS